MKIHIFIAHMGIGGAERVCVNLANELADMGNEVYIVVLNLEDDVNTHLLDSRVKVHSLGVSRLRYSAPGMLRYLKKYRPPFLFVFGNEMAVILNKMRKLRLINMPIIVRVLNNVNISLSKDDNISPIVEKYLQKAQKQLVDMEHVISQCNAMKKQLVEKKLVKPEQISVIYNPVSKVLTENVGALRDSIGQKAETEKEIAFIGRIDPQKNLSHLLQAFAMVKEKRENVRLRLVGVGNLTKQMEQLAEKLGVSDSVIFYGLCRDMEKIYENTDVVALSSEYEGMPNCLIEAIGCGIPVVSYDCPIGPAEIVVDGVNGYLVEYNNIEQLAERLLMALDKEWNAEEIKGTCSKFLVENVAKQYLKVFENVMADR